MSEHAPDTRVSVSLAQLRAELTAMELRIVDRLNGALANKADRAVLEQVASRAADNQARITILESSFVKKDGPEMVKLANIDQDITSLKTVAGYKKWLWAQTVALIGVSLTLLALFLDHGLSG